MDCLVPPITVMFESVKSSSQSQPSEVLDNVNPYSLSQQNSVVPLVDVIVQSTARLVKLKKK